MAKNTILILLLILQIACFERDEQSNKSNTSNNKNATPETVSTPDISIPDGWTIIPKPNEKSKIVQCAGNNRDFQQRVESEGEKVIITKNDEWTNDEQIIKLPENLRESVLQTRDIGNGSAYFHIEQYENGWLAGLDAGEWGGRLTWFSSDGKEKIVILQDNVRGIAKVGKETLILRGLNHLSMDDGSVSKLVKDENGNLQIQDLVKLEFMPKSFVVESNDSILISLRDKILRVKTNGEMELWREMPLNNFNVSMARTKSGIIYVGLWLFVVRFIPSEKGLEEQWLIPQNCQKVAIQKDTCECKGK